MKIIIAVDSFKGSLSAAEACEIIARGFHAYNPSLDIVQQPLADGGEGTAAIVLQSCNSQWVPCRVMGPLPSMQVDAGYVWLEQTQTALVEMAAASGITLLSPAQLNPMAATTFGTGELLADAIMRNPRKIIMAVGGSATVDGGVGAAMALGWKFLDRNGVQIPLGAASLDKIDRIVAPACSYSGTCEILCDVTNPLTGAHGAAHVFGPQKGADAAMVGILDRGLAHLADVVRQQLHKEIETIPGAGAAGGLAAGAMAFLNATLIPGIDAMINITGLDKAIADADWIITGEGCLDLQSLDGKVVSGIIRAAKNTNAKIGVIAGNVKLDEVSYNEAGICDTRACLQPGMSVEYAIANAKRLLFEAAVQFARRNF